MEDDTNNHLNEAINNRTMSTGAETPFSLVLSEGFDLGNSYKIQTGSTASRNSSGLKSLKKSKNSSNSP